ncbi:putative polyketide synthase [Xylariales sp. PMI_506]|nr:putative polyketide synthase [Xylariales sp. PMI_506]
MNTSERSSAIAIIGMGCRYPGGAHSPEELWDLVASSRDTWSDVPNDRYNAQAFYHPDPEAPEAVSQKGGHFLDQALADFDPGFFGISAPEAEAVDPLQRVVLETAWEAVENACIPMEKFRGSNTAVYVAMFGHDAEQLIHKDAMAFNRYQDYGVTKPLLANRLSYLFDLHGPSVMLDTACSGSLVAIHLACQALRLGEVSTAIAGGVGLIFSPDQMALMSLVGVFNSDGRSYTWDERGNGYGRGEGVGIVILKRLDDAIADGDPIRAVIRNSAVNQDGKTNGISLPNQKAQELLARDVFHGLPFSHQDIQYAEAHGTGTKVGDKIEMQAIRSVLASDRKAEKPLFVGAIKSNIGHSEAASGAAGLIRTVMAMEKGQIAPQALLNKFKPGLEPDGWNIVIPREMTPWPVTEGCRRAVVSSFGFGGTNGMLVLESAAQEKLLPSNGTSSSKEASHGVDVSEASETSRLFVLSAKSEYSASKTIERLKAYLEKHIAVDLDALSYTLASRRTHFPWRFAAVAHDAGSLIQTLSGYDVVPQMSPARKSLTVLVFTGQGAQWAQMGHRLFAVSPVFRESIEDCDAFLRRDLGANWSLIDELSQTESYTRLNDSRFGQPASTAIQLALVDLLRSWGIMPAAVLGHSSGEIAAAYAAGVLTRHAAMFVSYHRSFLAELSRERAAELGAMVAVGLGEKGVEKYLKGRDGLVAACINSPSSVTVSGDKKEIQEMEDALQKDQVFYRRLKVDTAYHSYHMKLVAQDYLDRLQGLESSATSPMTRFFSTVTEQEKVGDFGASYWASNLVSPVRFAGALQTMVRELGSSGQVVNLVEVGPHKALAGPVRQTLQQQQIEGLLYTYMATLDRGKDCVASLLTTGSQLYKAGILGLDPGIVASLGISDTETSPAPLTNLPPYAWDHGVEYWAESRLSREYRFRRHAYHDLLGSRVIASPGTQPSWRMLLSHGRLPWLKDHMVDDIAVFPAAGYMTMAIQALAQVHDGSPVPARGYNLKGITFKRALFFPKDAREVEVMLTFRHLDSDDSYDFAISSFSAQGKWLDHCTGNISRTEDTAFGDSGDEQRLLSRLEAAKKACTNVLGARELYSRLAALGNYYGPSFCVSKEVRLAASQAVNTVEIPDIASTMPAGFVQPHIIHPTVLDGLLQTALPVFAQHAQPGSFMPPYIADVWISTDIASQPGRQLDVLCDLSDTFSRSTNFDVSAFQHTQHTTNGVNPSLHCVLTISGGEALVVGDAKAASATESEQEKEKKKQKRFIWKSQWGVDIMSITAEMLESVVVPLQSDEAGMTQGEKVDLLDEISAKYISMAIQEIDSNRGGEDSIAKDFRKHQWRSFQALASSADWNELISRVPASYADLAQLAARLGAEGEAMERIGSKLVQVLTGQTNALDLLLEDQLLFRIYHGDEGARASQYMANYAAHLTFQRPGLRILEVGAGTGGTTAKVFKACSRGGTAPFCAEYMFTDISSGFFDEVRSGLLKPWAHMLSFQAFDLEQDPVEQGFEANSYDLIIAANVVHATASIRKSLRRIRKLLKPGGMLGLVELTRSLTSGGMIFGCLEGWWAGIHEGRVDGPVQNAEQWHGHLRASGFSGVDMVAYDLPEPQRHSALLLSTALPEGIIDDEHKNGALEERHEATIEVFSALPETSTNAEFVESLALELTKTNHCPVTMGNWLDSGVNDQCSYVILDSAENRLITNSTSERFSRVMSLLSRATKIYWITFAGTEGRVQGSIEPDNALATGLARVARAENNKLQCFTLDVQDDVTTSQTLVRDSIIELIKTSEARMDSGVPLEFEFSLRGGVMRIQRLVAEPCLQRLVSGDSEDVENDEDKEMIPFFGTEKLQLEVQKPGLLGSLSFVASGELKQEPEPDLGPYEVEIKPQAWGLNFKDVLIALGQLHPRQTMVGEVAGVIVHAGSKASDMLQLHPGDRVAAFTTYKSYYSNLTRTDARLLHKLPEYMTWIEAASLPVAFATASYSLVDCARLEPGMTVLVHAATGALGQAAVEIAQQAGATVFATAGTPEKRQLVADRFGIPKSRIFSSRTADFVRGIKHITGGRGVDVVLNSLAGPLLASSWECVADLGTFIELGKVDIWKRAKISMEPFDRGVRFVSVDMGVLCRRQPEVMQRVLQRVFSDVTAGRVRPLPPATTYSVGDIEMAFRYMQAGKHIGKIVLQADQDTTVISHNRKGRPAPPRLSSDATYIIAGGLGVVGKALCLHLQVLGARYIVLFTRRQLGDEDRFAQEKALVGTKTPGSLVKIVTCDVSDQHALHKATREIEDSSFPPIKGVIQGALVLSDRTLDQLTRADFDAVLAPRYQGTQNLWSTFAVPQPLDFFLLLSSMSGIIGSLGQGNYAATATYQDMFSYAVALAAPSNESESVSNVVSRQTLTKNVVSLDIPLIRNTQDITQEHVEALHRQGGLSVDMEDAFTIIDYAISGRAVSDGCHQISFGIHPELVRGVPLLSHPKFDYTIQQQQAQNQEAHDGELTHPKTKQNIDKAIAAAASAAEAEILILTALRDKVSSLTAVGGQLDFDSPVAGMGLDSLIATELKNWIFNTLSARVQNADIVDAPSLRVLAAQISQVSTLLSGKQFEPNTSVASTNEVLTPASNVDEEHALPKYPVQTLKQVLDNFIEAVSHIGTPMELNQTHRAMADFLDPRGMGQVMQARLEEYSRSTSDNESDTFTKADQGDVVEMYVRNKWLRTRSWRPRLRNFFGTIPGTIPSETELGRSQVSRAATLSLAAYNYKLALDHGKVQQDYQHDQPLSMDTVQWIFNAHRTPVIGCDRMDRWPGHDYIVVMRRGHVFKVPLQDSEASVLTAEQLAAIFEAILAHQAPVEVNWACLFTTAQRDEWATTRDQFIATSRENADFIDCIEKSLFIVYLEDALPRTPAERAEVFLLDDNSNRWLDKTLGLIICANGVAAGFLEHTMVDGTTFEGLAKAFAEYKEDEREHNQPGTPSKDCNDIASPGFTHLPFMMPASLADRIVSLRAEHLAAHDGYKLVNYDLTSYGTRWLREQRLPPKSVIQVLVQLAVRLVLGTNPSAVDVVSQRPFQGGRTDMIYTSIPEITAFCEAAVTATQVQDILVLFKEAIRAHAKLVALAQRGKSWRWHLAALGETLREGEELPELYRDPVYMRTGERRVATSFTEFGVPEMGRCPPKREDVWFGIEAFEERVHFTVINGEDRSKDFVEKLMSAADTIRGIIIGLNSSE